MGLAHFFYGRNRYTQESVFGFFSLTRWSIDCALLY
jgi:hypothetical protein